MKRFLGVVLALALPALVHAQTTIVPGRNYLAATDGSATTPTKTYAADTDLGTYRIGANNEGFTAGGTLRWDYNASRLKLSSGYQLEAGGAVTLTNGNANALYAKNTGGTAKHAIGINSSDQLLISGDGATAKLGGALVVQDGTPCSAPSIVRDGQNTGLVFGSNLVRFCLNGSLYMDLGSGNLSLNQGIGIGFSPSGASADAKIARYAAAKLKLTDSAGTSGGVIDFATDGVFRFLAINGTDTAIVRGKTVQVSAGTFSQCNASPEEGMLCSITDSSTDVWGATVTGGGALHVLARYNGTNWTVAAK